MGILDSLTKAATTALTAQAVVGSLIGNKQGYASSGANTGLVGSVQNGSLANTLNNIPQITSNGDVGGTTQTIFLPKQGYASSGANTGISGAVGSVAAIASIIPNGNLQNTLTKVGAIGNGVNTISNFIDKQGYASSGGIQAGAGSLAAMASMAGFGGAAKTLSGISKLAGVASALGIGNAAKPTSEAITTYFGAYSNINKTDRNNHSVSPSPLTKFNKFVTEVKHRGVAKQCNFLVEITPPPFIVPDGEIIGLVHMFCDQIMFPEMVLATTSIKDAGLTREVVYDKIYGTVNATFICDQEMIVKKFFDDWISGTVHKTNGVFNYPNRYTANRVRIHQLDARKNIVYTVTLNRVVVKIVNDIILTASSRDVSHVQVQFAYESWESFRHKMDDDPSNADAVNLDDIEQGVGYDDTDISDSIIEDTEQTGETITVPTEELVDYIDVLGDEGYI